MNTVGKKSFPGNQHQSGIGYVIWPSDISREDYVQKCLTTYTLSMITEEGGVYNRIPFSMSCVDDVVFPETNDRYGSVVFWVLNAVMKQPIIVGVMKPSQVVGDLTEHFFKWARDYEGSFIEISGSAKDKVVNTIINVDKDGVYNLLVKNKKRQGALINVETTGSIKILSTEQTVLSQYGSFVIETTSEDNEDTYSSFKQLQDSQTFTSQKVEFLKRESSENEQSQPMVLGNTFKSLLNDLIDEISKITVTTAIGQMPILNAAQIEAFKERTDSILSQLTFSE